MTQANSSKKPPMADSSQQPKGIEFGCFDRDVETDVTERNLPHWFQPGAAIFITFRTADSTPREVIERWQRELKLWLLSRNLPLELAESTVIRRCENHDQLLDHMTAPDRSHFKKLSDQIFHRSLDDCHGDCLLRQPKLAKIVGDAMRFFDDQKYDLDRFVIMVKYSQCPR